MNALEHGFEVSEAQEELVRLNLRIKTLNASFSQCDSHRRMERLNAETRALLDKMRRTLQRLRGLASRQNDSDATKMLLSDVDNHADQLASCQRGFRQANLRCIAELERQGRDSLFAPSGEDGVSNSYASDDLETVRQRRRQRDKEDLVTNSGHATDRLAAISRQLAETVQRSVCHSRFKIQ